MANIGYNYVGELEDVAEEVDDGAERLEEGAGVHVVTESPYPCPFTVPRIGKRACTTLDGKRYDQSHENRDDLWKHQDVV